MILLTKAVNQLLEENGLEKLTVIRNDDGYIVLAGRACYRPILEFSTMKVGSKLTKEERTILIEDYITPMITKNKKHLLEYISLKKDTTIDDKIETFKKDNNIFVFQDKKNYHDEDREIIIKDTRLDSAIKISTKTNHDKFDLTSGTNNHVHENILKLQIKDIDKKIERMLILLKEYKTLIVKREDNIKTISDKYIELQEVCKF